MDHLKARGEGPTKAASTRRGNDGCNAAGVPTEHVGMTEGVPTKKVTEGVARAGRFV